MNKIRFISVITLFLLINQNVVSQQFHDFNFLEKKADSVIISNVYYQNKEFSTPLAINNKPAVKDSITGKWSLPYSDTKEVKDTIFNKSTKKLSKTEVYSLDKILRNKGSYLKKGVALLSHYDIEISYYKKGEVFQWVKISSLTKKITISKEKCMNSKDNHGNIINPCIYYASISKRFEKEVNKLIK